MESVEDCVDSISGDVEEVPYAFDLKFFKKMGSKTSKIISNSDGSVFLAGQNRDYIFEFLESMYVSHVTVFVENYSEYNYCEFSWDSVSKSQKVDGKVKCSSESFDVYIYDVIKGFSFKPNRSYKKNPKIKCIEVVGYSMPDFEKACEKISDIDGYRDQALSICREIRNRCVDHQAEIVQLESQKSSVEEDVEKIKRSYGVWEEDLGAIEDSVELAKGNLETLKQQESHLEDNVARLKDAIDTKQKKSGELNSQIVDNESKLRKLKDDINMFPTEINAFVDQGSRSIARYTVLSIIPVLVLVTVVYALFNSAVDLTVIHKTQPDLSIWSVFLSRLPFVTISIFVIHASYKIARVFIEEIIRINQQRLNLSKMAIVAKDVSDASCNSLDISTSDKYELRTKLKMELLREHLKEYVKDDYEYGRDLDISDWMSKVKRPSKETEEDKDDQVS